MERYEVLKDEYALDMWCLGRLLGCLNGLAGYWSCWLMDDKVPLFSPFIPVWYDRKAFAMLGIYHGNHKHLPCVSFAYTARR